MLDRVRQRGEQLRARRRLGTALGLLAFLLVVAVPAAILTGDEGGRTTVAATASTSMTSAVTSIAPGEPTTTSPIPTTIGAAAISPSTTGAPRTTTTPFAPAPAEAATTTGHSGASSKSDLDTSSTCGPEVVEAVASTDRPTYKPGETVVVTSTVRNVSSQPCHYVGSDFRYTFRTSSGTPLAGGTRHSDRFSADPLTLAPDQALTGTGQWDQRDCLEGPDGCRRAGSGTYVVEFTWSFETPVRATTSFQLD